MRLSALFHLLHLVLPSSSSLTALLVCALQRFIFLKLRQFYDRVFSPCAIYMCVNKKKISQKLNTIKSSVRMFSLTTLLNKLHFLYAVRMCGARGNDNKHIIRLYYITGYVSSVKTSAISFQHIFTIWVRRFGTGWTHETLFYNLVSTELILWRNCKRFCLWQLLWYEK